MIRIDDDLMPWWCPEAMDLREKTIDARVTGILRKGQPWGEPSPMVWYTILGVPDDARGEDIDRLNLSLRDASHAAFLWNGGREPDEPKPVSDGEAFWGDVVGFGDDNLGADDDLASWDGKDDGCDYDAEDE
jgi:hypothetical protein